MDLNELRRLAAKEELSLNYIAKDEMVSKVLAKLQKFENIVLKGGTAINRVYLKNKRFSEDIDLDLIFDSTVKLALTVTNEIIKNIEGFNIARPRIMKETIRYDLFYINPLAHQDKIMLEFKVIKKAVNYSKKIVNFGFVPYESSLMNVYSIEELIKQKVACIMTRNEGKDFFDLYYLLEVSHEAMKIDKEKIIERITFEEKEIRVIADTLNHYVPKKQRPDWKIFLEQLKEKIREVG
ncbi:nucleotidyl transferase AbiEii/AbiGii toxin family protein [Candidatus Woesearchaeota archaeon]|nr:nucleotidyl transferase AbiEii/AbiGii toxin family protein [Candidatus Woesearchaeota archaeon]